jgi:hypothetical protein
MPITVFGRTFGEATPLVEAERTELSDVGARLEAATFRGDRLEESVRELSLWLEDLNWTRLENWDAQDDGFSLQAVRTNADKLRALLTLNPTIKKAINARVGYIWGRGVLFDIPNNSLKKRIFENPRNQAVLFSENAYWGLEAKLATDGNVWAQRNTQTNAISLIPIQHIGGFVTDPDDPARVNYWLIQYQKAVQNFATGETKQEEVKYWVPAHDAVQANTRVIDGIKIDRNFEMVHLAANRQHGWILGVPDIMAVMFWTKAHKELFEAGTTFIKAQGKFAAKVVAKTDAGGQAAAATLRDQPRRNPETGEVMNYGGTAVATGGLDYQLMGKMTGGVDFSQFDAVGGLVAAGLGIPTSVLLGKSMADVESLEQTTVTEMQLRQKAWTWFFEALFSGKASVSWPKIRTEPEYRRIQSIEIANQSNVLWRDELRALSLEAFDMQDKHDGALPPITQQPQVAISAQQLIKQQQADAAQAKIIADQQGTSTGIGKLSDGQDSKNARNDTTDTNVQGQ